MTAGTCPAAERLSRPTRRTWPKAASSIHTSAANESRCLSRAASSQASAPSNSRTAVAASAGAMLRIRRSGPSIVIRIGYLPGSGLTSLAGITDREAVRKLLDALGYTEIITVDKIRRQWQLAGVNRAALHGGNQGLVVGQKGDI